MADLEYRHTFGADESGWEPKGFPSEVSPTNSSAYDGPADQPADSESSGYQLPTGPQSLQGPADDSGGIQNIPTLGKVGLVLEALGAGYHGREPLYAKLEQQQAVQRQHADLLRAKQQQQVEQQRSRQMNEALKVFTNHDMPWTTRSKALTQMGGMGNPYAQSLDQVGSEATAANIQAYLPYMDEDIKQRWEKDPRSVPAAELEAHVGIAKKNFEATVKERAEAKMVGGLEAKFKHDPNSLTDAELEVYDKHHKAKEERALKIRELQAKTDVAEQTVQPAIQKAQAEAASANVKSRMDVATEYARTNEIKARANKENAPTVSPMFVVDDQGTVAHYVTTPDGKTKMVLGKPVTRTQDMSSTMLAKRSELVALKRQTEDLWDKFKDDYAGRWDAIRMGLQGATNTLPPDAAAFVTSWDTYVKALRKEALGTAQSARELSTNKYAFPELSQGETVIREFMKNQHKQIVTKLQAQRDVVDESRRKDPPMASARLQQLKSMAPLLYKSKEEAEQAIGSIMADELSRGLLVDDHGK